MTLILLFILGAIFGSAANALIDRLPRKQSWLKGRSHCDKCKHQLNSSDLVPVISYLWLRGKCRYCHSPIPIRNLIVELLMGLGFILIFNFQIIFFNQFSIFNVIILLLILWVTTIIAVMDWENMLVSEILVLIWGVFVVLENFAMQKFQFTNNLIGLGVGVVLIGGLWAVSRGKAMGFGDVEIAAVMGFWLGWPNIFWGLEIAFVSGALVGLLQILRHKNKLKGRIAFGTFLIIGAWVAHFI